MSNLQVYYLFSERQFPLRDNYISFKGSFHKNVKSKISFLNNHFNILLKKNKKEQEICDAIKSYNLMVKSIEEQKEKKIRYEINKKLRMLFYQQKLKSVSNNKMLLDLMATNTKFIKYLNKQKSHKSINSANLKTTHLDSMENPSFIKKNDSSPFITEIKGINKKANNDTYFQKGENNNIYNTIDYKQKNEYNNTGDDFFSLRLKKSLLKKEATSYKNFNSLSLRNSNNNNILNKYFKKRQNSNFYPNFKVKRNKNFFSLKKNYTSKFNSTNNSKKLILKYSSPKNKNIFNK